ISRIYDNAALTTYFDPHQFDGLDVEGLVASGGYLQEGDWTVCVTAYEIAFGRQVSNTSCRVLFLEEHEPPFIINPLDYVLPTIPQNIRISWQPMHLGNFPVEY